MGNRKWREVASPEDAQEVCGVIREWIGQHHGPGVAEQTRILYGGSVKSTNIAAHGQNGRDGAFDRWASPSTREELPIVCGTACTHRSPPEVTLVFAVPEEGSPGDPCARNHAAWSPVCSLIALVLLHKGKGGGLSDLFGGGVSTLGD